jgi:UDP-N-acetylmuramyl pentapeptide synthase
MLSRRVLPPSRLDVRPLKSSRDSDSVRPVEGRLEVKIFRDGGCVIDDSYNANPSSLQAGLAVLAQADGSRWLVLGNMGELGALRL